MYRRLDPRFGKLPISRRTMLKGGVGAAVVAGGARFGAQRSFAQEGPEVGPLPNLEGVTLRIFSMTGPFISGPVRVHAPQFEALTGARIEVIDAPYADLFTRAQQVAQTGSGDFDILLLSNTWVADFVDLDFVISLDDYIAQDADDPNLQWDDVPEGLIRKNTWGSNIYGLIVDNDNHQMFYRKDVLADPMWQEQYQAETGNELPNPPQTMQEFMDVARFFSGKDWGDTEGDKYGFITSVRRGAQAFHYAYPWTAAYSVVPADDAPAPGIYLFDPDMNPLVNNEGFVQGLTHYVETIEESMRPGGDSDRGAVIDEIKFGRALMSFDWGDTGPASVAPDSVVKDAVGFSMVPGVDRYFDWQTDSWVEMADGDIHRVPTHAFNGWSYYITSQSQNPDAAWEWIKFHASPPISAIDVASPDSGYQPWRNSHADDLSSWVDAGWTESEAAEYVQTILDVTAHPNAVFDLRIPGAAQYQEALELHILRAVFREADPQAAMDDCARDFESITDQLGRDNAVSAYRAHLGLE